MDRNIIILLCALCLACFIVLIPVLKFFKEDFKRLRAKWEYGNEKNHYEIEPFEKEPIPGWKKLKDMGNMEKAEMLDLIKIMKKNELVGNFYVKTPNAYCKLYIIGNGGKNIRLYYVEGKHFDIISRKVTFLK